MTTLRVSRGPGLRTHRIVHRFESIGHGRGRAKLTTGDIPTIRKMLREGKTIVEIATALGCHAHTIARFIKQRGIANPNRPQRT